MQTVIMTCPLEPLSTSVYQETGIHAIHTYIYIHTGNSDVPPRTSIDIHVPRDRSTRRRGPHDSWFLNISESGAYVLCKHISCFVGWCSRGCKGVRAPEDRTIAGFLIFINQAHMSSVNTLAACSCLCKGARAAEDRTTAGFLTVL